MTLSASIDMHYKELQELHRFVGEEEEKAARGERTEIAGQVAVNILSTLQSKKTTFYSLYLPLLVNQCDQLIGRVQHLAPQPSLTISVNSAVEEVSPPSPASLASTIPIFPVSPSSQLYPGSRVISEGHYNFVVRTAHEVDAGVALTDSKGKVTRLMEAGQYFFQLGYTRLANFCMELIRRISRIFQKFSFRDAPSISTSTAELARPQTDLSIRSENSFINRALSTMMSHEKSRVLLESVSFTYKGIGGVEIISNPASSAGSWRTPFDVLCTGKILARPARISVPPSFLEDEGKLIDTLIFELLNASQEEDFSKISLQAVRDEVNRGEFIKASELLEYQTLKKQRAISASLAEHGIPVKECTNPFRDEEHFWEWTQSHNSGHAEAHGLRFDQLRRYSSGEITRLA